MINKNCNSIYEHEKLLEKTKTLLDSFNDEGIKDVANELIDIEKSLLLEMEEYL